MHKMSKLFSVIVPVYNVKDYLEECLDSLLGQTMDDYEIIVVDDCSTDGSLEIARAYARENESRVRCVEHAVNKGLGGARNTGIESARGRYLLFIDSDDYIHPQTLEKIAALITDEAPDIVEFCFEFVDENGSYLRQSRIPASVCGESGRERSLLTRTVSATNKAFRASLFGEEIRFPEKRYYEDYWTVPKLLMMDCRCASLNEPLYAYRQRMNSIIHDTNIEKSRDIMLGTDELLRFWDQEKLDDEIREELEYLAIRNVLYHTTLRVNGIDRRSEMQRRLKAYMTEHFPGYMENPWLSLLSKKEGRLLSLIQQERYGQLYLTYHEVNKIKGAVKRLLHRVGARKLVQQISGR